MKLKQNNNYKWIVLAISFMLMFTFAVSLQSLPPIFDKISEDISFSNSEAGLLMGIYAIPGVFLPFLIAYLATKYNEKHMISGALLILILGLVGFSMSKSFTSLLGTRLIAGIGATVLVVLAPLLVTMFFDEDNMGTAMGFFNIAVPAGTVFSANMFGVLGEKFYWRYLILGIAVFAGLAFLINNFILSVPNKKEEELEDSSMKDSFSGLFSNVGIWLLALIWMLGNFQLLSYVTFAPQFFQSSGMTIQKSGLLTSFIMLMPIFLSPFVGIIIDKTGWRKRLVLAGSLIIGTSFILFSQGTIGLMPWAITLGIGFAPIPVFVFSQLPFLIPPHQMGMGLGVITIASNLGIAVGPSVFGFLLDKTSNNFSIGFMFLALISLIIIITLGGLAKTIKNN